MTDNANPGSAAPGSIASATEFDQPVMVKSKGVYPFQVQANNPYWVGYSTIVVSDAVPGHNYALQISSTELNGGVPVTVSYQCVAGDTKEVVATKLSAACRANPVLYDPATGLPILFWDTGGGGLTCSRLACWVRASPSPRPATTRLVKGTSSCPPTSNSSTTR